MSKSAWTDEQIGERAYGEFHLYADHTCPDGVEVKLRCTPTIYCADLMRQVRDDMQARAKLDEVFFRAFPVGARVAWVTNGRNGKYGQFGAVVENRGMHCIFVVNNKTQNRIRFDAESAHSYELRVMKQEQSHG